MKKFFFFIILVFSFCSYQTKVNNSNFVLRFGTPVEVEIIGYNGDSMEPFISRDGKYLFFNNLNSSLLPNGNFNDTNIFFAERINYDTFKFRGAIKGADTDCISNKNELEAVPSMDNYYNFFFINTINYLNKNSPYYMKSLFKAKFSSGELKKISSVKLIFHEKRNINNLIFGAEISCDGNIIYFSDGVFRKKSLPRKADIKFAIKRKDGSFEVPTEYKKILKNINTSALEYAPSVSCDMKELYFTRFEKNRFRIFYSLRDTRDGIWQKPIEIKKIRGKITEAPSIDTEKRFLYFHQKVDGVFRIFVLKIKRMV